MTTPQVLEYIEHKRTCVHHQEGDVCKAGVAFKDVEIAGPFHYTYAGLPGEHQSKVATPCFEGVDFGCAKCTKRQFTPRPRAPVCLIGLPTYNSQIHAGMITGLVQPSKVRKTHITLSGGSVLTFAFNVLWAKALAMNVSWLAMLHADIVPTAWWLDVMIDEMDRTGADVISAVSPIKDGRGLTSTGVDQGTPDNPWHVRRLTMKELFTLPATFSRHDTSWPDRALLVNTGCMLVDMRRDWVRRFPGFTIHDQLIDKECGRCHGAGCTGCGDRGWVKLAHFEPEDWNFSRWLHAQGCRVYATRAVTLHHHGATAFPNDTVWGSLEKDDAS